MARIVVMDDDDVIRKILHKILEMEGHTVITFPDAAPALETVDFTQVDLIITDLSMLTPGEIFIRTLKAKDIQVPIIVMSGYIDEDKAHYLKFLGARKVMRKPFILTELLALIQKWV